jgi:uncharacterized protein (UPF0548 family)
MFFLTEPSDKTVAQFISSQRELPYTYQTVGATKTVPPADYNIDHNRIKLGHGEKVYRRATDALKAWRQFDLGWASIVPVGVPLAVGATVAVKARAFGSWSLNAARVVYLIDEEASGRRFGFAYGTLPDHVEQGEERFLIEWFPDDSVWYDILAFSRPRHPLVRLTFPLARLLQKRFALESMKRMAEVIAITK